MLRECISVAFQALCPPMIAGKGMESVDMDDCFVYLQMFPFLAVECLFFLPFQPLGTGRASRFSCSAIGGIRPDRHHLRTCICHIGI